MFSPSLLLAGPLASHPLQFFFYFLIMLLNLMSFTAFGMLVVHATPQLEAANALAGTIFALYNLFCGFIK
jgi:ABC-type multidrug transport system permease subunit